MNFEIWLTNISSIWNHLGWMDLVDLVLVWMLTYRALLFIRGTGAVQMLAGLGIVASGYILSIWQNLDTLNWVLEQFFANLLIVVVILFQAEIRRALSMIGRNPFFTGVAINQEARVMEEIIKGVKMLSREKLGALIVMEREIGLDNFVERGISMDAEIVAELIHSIFSISSPLHDGAIIVKGGRIGSASSVLPLTKNQNVSMRFGTRHRAAIGITEETDALVVVVSEENQRISIVEHGEILTDIDLAQLRKTLYKEFNVDMERARKLSASN
ncbi:MAG: diadenylate cyclase CdaA [Bdellovibrionales bacterium]